MLKTDTYFYLYFLLRFAKMASGTAWQSPLDGTWLQALSVDLGKLHTSDSDLPKAAQACEEETEALRKKNAVLRRKVRRAKGKFSSS